MDPASRIRGYYVAKYLSENGFDVKVFLYESVKGNVVKKGLHLIGDFLNKIRAVMWSDKDVLVYIQRGTCSLSQLSFLFFLFSKFIFRKKVIYDIDDGLFLEERFVINNFIRFSDHVTVGGHELFKYVKKYKERVFLVPTSADLNRYYPHNNVRKGNRVRLGFVGSPSTTPYMELLVKSIEELSRRYDLELRVISASSYAEYRLFNSFRKFEKNGVKVKLIPWNVDEEFYQLQNIDIGLAPLPNEEWERYKCGFKVINYMAAGIPPVASNVGEHKYIIQDGVNGFLCSNDQEWIEKLQKLIVDKTLRENMGANARKTVEKKYSMEENIKILAKILAEI